MNFETDAYEQITKMSRLPTLDKAARLAGEQLELLKPAVMGSAKDGGLYAGSVAYVDRGQVLIVLSNGRKVMTFYVAPNDGFSASEMLRSAADYARDIFQDPWCAAYSAKAGEEALKKYGGKPGKRCPDVHPQVGFQIIGALFACCDDEKLHDLGTGIDILRKADICPSVIFLVGPGSSGEKGTHSLATMMLPLAPYAEAVLDAH